MEQVKQPSTISIQDQERINNERASTYLAHFPAQLDFFGMGLILPKSKSCLPAESAGAPFTVTFQMSGEEAGLCVVAFETVPAKDEEGQSMALEIANIVASKFVTKYADASVADLRLSPPAVVPAGSQASRYLKATLEKAELACSRRYEYAGSGFELARLTLRLTFLPASRGGNS